MQAFGDALFLFQLAQPLAVGVVALGAQFDDPLLQRPVGVTELVRDLTEQLERGAQVRPAAGNDFAHAADRVFEFSLEWVENRYSFGRPISSYQEIKHRFADMKMWLEASHAITDAAARAVQDGAEDAALTVSAAKAYVGDHVPELVQDCVQMHGGIGVTFEADIHIYLRRVTLDRALYGTPAEHRERIVARVAAS